MYAYVRRSGVSAADAEDLTQGYFARFIEKEVVRDAHRDRGRFRAFLLVSVRHYLSNERDRERAQKRGGGRRLVSLDAEAAEKKLAAEPPDPATPETEFEKSWARTVMDRVWGRLADHYARRGKSDRFARLKPFLQDGAPGAYDAEVAAEWGVSPEAVRLELHRMKKRFGDFLREEIGRTVDDPADVDDEIRHLFEVLGP
ncbi:MAG: sigma-70 family RNA polymerase sigma factor [Vicinamibacteria bacterium]